jgi:hypothetical protein
MLLAACVGEAEETPVPADTAVTVADTATAVPTTASRPQVATAVPVQPTSTTVPPTNTPQPTPSATPVPVVVLVPDGQLEVRITDAPPPGVTKILVTISLIEVHKAGAAGDAGWIPVFEGDERTFDLVAATAIEDVLGTETFAAGKYTQIRMDVVSVTVTVEGEVREATVPGDKLRVVRPFDVEEGIVTVLTLDFDAEKSVVITGNGAVQFKPVVKLLVRKES